MLRGPAPSAPGALWCALPAALLLTAAATAAEKPPPARPVTPETLAWWTFDNHLRDEAQGLTLANPGNANRDAEEAYGNPYGTEVPVREFGDRLNWRTYYRWLDPNLTSLTLGKELDLPRAFTIEAYLRPRNYPGYPIQPRAYVLRKNRIGPEDARQPQWAVELRRRPDSKQERIHWADLWVMVAFQLPDGSHKTVEAEALDVIRLENWNRVGVVYNGKEMALWVDGQRVATAAGPGEDAAPLPTLDKAELLLSNENLLEDGKTPTPRDKMTLTTMYGGQIDELRITGAALTPERFLPEVRVYAGDPLPDPPARKEYTSLVARHLDVLMKHGTDTYGPVSSPLIGSTLDPQTLRMMTLKPPAGIGMPRVYSDPYRSPIQGVNMTDLRDTLMAMWALSDVTGDRRYADHADKALRFWLDNCAYPSGAWPEGEHGVWNFYTDKPELKRPIEPGIHFDYESLWKMAPERVQAHIVQMRVGMVFEEDGVWHHQRHGTVSGPSPKGGEGFIRHTGLLARAFAFLYSKTRDPQHAQWARDMVDQAVRLRDPKTGFYPTQTYPPAGKLVRGKQYPPAGAGTQPIVAAVGFLEAARWLDEPADRQRFQEVATDMAMVNILQYGRWDGEKFTRPLPNWVNTGDTWPVLKFYELAGRPQRVMEFLRFYADEAIRDWKPTTSTSAADFGHRILFLAQLSLETGEEKYMEHARRGADYAAAGLALENGLLIISGLYRYYDQSQGVDLLAQGFLALDHPRHPAVRRLFDVTK